jgi:hypothetical protein
LEKNLFVRDELLGRGRHRFVSDDSDFGNLENILIRIMGLRGLNDDQERNHNGQQEHKASHRLTPYTQ